MKHVCPGLEKCKMVNYNMPPHMLDSCLEDAPDGGGMLLTVLYMNAKDDTKVGWGMRFSYCPACGECLKNIKKRERIYKANEKIRATIKLIREQQKRESKIMGGRSGKISRKT